MLWGDRVSVGDQVHPAHLLYPAEPHGEGAHRLWAPSGLGYGVLGPEEIRAPGPGSQELHVSAAGFGVPHPQCPSGVLALTPCPQAGRDADSEGG